MRRLRHLPSAILLALVLNVASASAQDDRAHELAGQAGSQTAVQCTNVSALADCHPGFPTGCTHALQPRYDPYLNFLKNQDPGRDVLADRILRHEDFVGLEASIPTGLGRTNHADSADALASLNGLGEGNIYAVVAYLYFVEDTARTSRHRGETTNCQLTQANAFDFHLGIGFDATLARHIRQNPPPHDPSNPGLPEQTSIVAEMTPHTRDPKWTVARLNRQRGKQIKVIGQLLLDNDHVNQRDDCAFLGDPGGTCWRATVWEIHPVTQFFVCKAGRVCTETSPDTDWVRLEDLP